MSRVRRWLTLGVVGATGAAVALGASTLIARPASTAAQVDPVASAPRPQEALDAAQSLSRAFEHVAATIQPSVVSISSAKRVRPGSRSPATPLHDAIDKARRAVKSERLLFRGQRQLRDLTGENVVLIDGHAVTPWKLLAAAHTARELGAQRIFVAAAVTTLPVKERVLAYSYEFVCPTVVLDPDGHPHPFGDPQDASAELRSIVVARQVSAA